MNDYIQIIILLLNTKNINQFINLQIVYKFILYLQSKLYDKIIKYQSNNVIK